MATIDSKHIIDNLLANNGCYQGDPQLFMIVEYQNYEGNTVWGITYPHERGKLRYIVPNPPYVNNPKIIWTQELGVIK